MNTLNQRFGNKRKQKAPKVVVEIPRIKYLLVSATCSLKFEVCATREARIEERLFTTDQSASATYMSRENTPVKILPSAPEFSKKYK